MNYFTEKKWYKIKLTDGTNVMIDNSSEQLIITEDDIIIKVNFAYHIINNGYLYSLSPPTPIIIFKQNILTIISSEKCPYKTFEEGMESSLKYISNWCSRYNIT